jgi:hypothetical protein
LYRVEIFARGGRAGSAVPSETWERPFWLSCIRLAERRGENLIRRFKLIGSSIGEVFEKEKIDPRYAKASMDGVDKLHADQRGKVYQNLRAFLSR